MGINLLIKMKNKNIVYTLIGGVNRHFQASAHRDQNDIENIDVFELMNEKRVIIFKDTPSDFQQF